MNYERRVYCAVCGRRIKPEPLNQDWLAKTNPEAKLDELDEKEVFRCPEHPLAKRMPLGYIHRLFAEMRKAVRNAPEWRPSHV